MRERIYVIGALTSCGDVDDNVEYAVDIARQLKDKGHLVFVPHIHGHVIDEGDEDEVYWYMLGLSMLKYWASAVFLLPSYRFSFGSLLELSFAHVFGLNVYYDISDVNE